MKQTFMQKEKPWSMKIQGFKATVANAAFLKSVNSGVRSSAPIYSAPKLAHLALNLTED